MATTVLSSPFSYRDKISGSSHSTCCLDSCHVFFIALSACWPCSYPYSLPCSLFLTQHPEKLFGSLNETMMVQCMPCPGCLLYSWKPSFLWPMGLSLFWISLPLMYITVLLNRSSHAGPVESLLLSETLQITLHLSEFFLPNSHNSSRSF